MSIRRYADQSQTPLLSALQTWAIQDYAPFHTPGHKRGQGAGEALRSLLGSAALQADLPELPELDNLFAPQGVIEQAQGLAAMAFGADRTWFLANGSTGGVIATILATCRPGDKLLLPRNVHQSVISGLILAGVDPVFVQPDYDAVLDIAHGVTVNSIEQALLMHRDIRAILIVCPTYYGVCCDVVNIAHLAHRHQIPLIVDEAHGAHFKFHPELPMTALEAGADVVIQSTHKTLSALTQASMLHLQGNLVDAERIRRSLQLVQSTSPSYLLLASLDAARHQMATLGQALLTQTLTLVEQTRTSLIAVPGVQILQLQQRPGFIDLDRTRLTITVSGLGKTGFESDEILSQQFGVICELPSLQHLTFIFSGGTTQADCDRLVGAIADLAKRSVNPIQTAKTLQQAFPLSACPLPEVVQSPRQAFFATSKTVELEQSIDQVSAELICPYPPGIPVLLPGERITAAAIDYLQRVLRSGGFISGCADPTLKTIQVVE
jgi:arginine decarboxylase